MKIAPRPIDDLKTERPDVTPPLAPYLRLVPILFYAFLAGAVLLSAFFFLLLRNATAARESWRAETAARQQKLTEVQARRGVVEQESRRASEIVAWVEGSRNLQPLVVTTIRSMATTSSIAELALARNPENPAQIKIKLKLNAQGTQQLDATLAQIASLGFRTYSPNQTQTRGEVDYEATLIHQRAREPAATAAAEVSAVPETLPAVEPTAPAPPPAVPPAVPPAAPQP